MVELIVRLSDLGESPVLQDLMVIGQNHILPRLQLYIYTWALHIHIHIQVNLHKHIHTHTYTVHVEVFPTVMYGRNDTVGSFSSGKKCSF